MAFIDHLALAQERTATRQLPSCKAARSCWESALPTAGAEPEIWCNLLVSPGLFLGSYHRLDMPVTPQYEMWVRGHLVAEVARVQRHTLEEALYDVLHEIIVAHTYPAIKFGRRTPVDLMKCLYEFRDNRVEGFLDRNRTIIKELVEGFDVITAAEFFSVSKLGLKIYPDPEDGREQLVVLIPSNFSPAEALEKYEGIKNRWFRAAFRRLRGLIGIRLEYR